MLAAMFSATASMVSSQLNVFSGVITNDIYRPLKGGILNDSQMVRAGRIFTVLLGVFLILIAMSIPHLGGAERVIISLAELMVVTLLAPTLWGLFSRNVNSSAVWITGITGFTVGAIVHFGLGRNSFLVDFDLLKPFAKWVQANSSTMKTFTGVVFPVIILLIIQLLSRKPSAGYAKITALEAEEEVLEASGRIKASHLPAIIVAWSIAACGLMMLALTLINDESKLVTGIFASVLFAIAGGISLIVRIAHHKERKVLDL